MWRAIVGTLCHRRILILCFLAVLSLTLLAASLLFSGTQAQAIPPRPWSATVGLSLYEDSNCENTLRAADARGLQARPDPVGGEDPVTPPIPASATVTFDNNLDAYQVSQGMSIIVDGMGYSSSQLPLSFTWPLGTMHTFSTSAASVEIPGGNRYGFQSWSDGSTLASRTITLTGPARYEAIYKRQCYLTVISRYGSSAGTGWYDAGAMATFSVSSTAAEERAGSRYSFLGWSGDSMATAPQTTIRMDSPKTVIAIWQLQYSLTVQTLNGQTQVSWHNANALANISVPGVIDQGNNTRHRFTGWSGDLSASTPVASLMMDSPKTVTANWQLQYRLVIWSDVGAPVFQEWHDANSEASFSVPDIVDHGNGVRYLFLMWSGDSTARTLEARVVMNSPKTVTANWQTQYYLTVKSDYGGASREQWYEANTQAMFSVPPVVDHLDGSRHVFIGWSDTAFTTPEVKVTMTSPRSVTALWQLQYSLTFQSEYGQDQTGWHNADALANLTVPDIVDHGDGSRHRFTGWSGALSASTPAASLVMDSPKKVTANWQLQYRLSVTSGFAPPVFQEWHDANSEASFSVPPVVNYGEGVRHLFTGWSGDSTAKTPQATIKMNSPKTVAAAWQFQYLLIVISDYGEVPQEQWCEADTEVAFSVPPVADHKDGTRHIFAGWDDPALLAPGVKLMMDSPKTVRARWQLQYHLAVKSDYGEAKWEEWHGANSEAGFSVPAIVDHGDGSRHVFTGWTGDLTATAPEGRVKMDSPRSVTAWWQLQHYLAIQVVPPGVTSLGGEGWYHVGTAVPALSVPGIVHGDQGTMYVFLAWEVDGIERHDDPLPIAMDQPHAVTAAYKTLYYLSVDSVYGSPQGTGWYSSGSQASISVTSPVGILMRHSFVRWNGEVRTDEPSTTVLMDEPKAITAEWRADNTQLHAVAGGALFVIVAVLSSLALKRRKRA